MKLNFKLRMAVNIKRKVYTMMEISTKGQQNH